MDWLLWNLFTGSRERGWTFEHYVNEGYSRFEALSGVAQLWEGVNCLRSRTSNPLLTLPAPLPSPSA